MTKKDALGHPVEDKEAALRAAKTGPGLKDQQGPGKQNPNPGDQGPHGGGEGLTGMQPGAGHPRGR